jgi:hypothetical protein
MSLSGTALQQDSAETTRISSGVAQGGGADLGLDEVVAAWPGLTAEQRAADAVVQLIAAAREVRLHLQPRLADLNDHVTSEAWRRFSDALDRIV